MIESVQNDDQSQFGDDEDTLSDAISIGENFIVLVDEGNDEGMPYYVLQC